MVDGVGDAVAVAVTVSVGLESGRCRVVVAVDGVRDAVAVAVRVGHDTVAVVPVGDVTVTDSVGVGDHAVVVAVVRVRHAVTVAVVHLGVERTAVGRVLGVDLVRDPVAVDLRLVDLRRFVGRGRDRYGLGAHSLGVLVCPFVVVVHKVSPQRLGESGTEPFERVGTSSPSRSANRAR